jgi:hypothetical protein
MGDSATKHCLMPLILNEQFTKKEEEKKKKEKKKEKRKRGISLRTIYPRIL